MSCRDILLDLLDGPPAGQNDRRFLQDDLPVNDLDARSARRGGIDFSLKMQPGDGDGWLVWEPRMVLKVFEVSVRMRELVL